MKIIVALWFLLAVVGVSAQVRLDSGDITNLVKVSEIYSANPNLSGDNLEASLRPLRTPKLTTLIDTLLVVGKGDGMILSEQFLKRPGDDDLYMWYVVREVHYNLTNDSKKRRPNIEVAKETLAKKIDSRWLLDNYYYRVRAGIAMHFNNADLSGFDLKTDNFGLKDKTERAIFFLNVMEAVGGGRFMVLLATQNYKRIVEFSNRFPKFDGNEYYTYKDFDYPDFGWIGHEKLESYNLRHLDRFYITLVAHYRAETELNNKSLNEKIFKESILNEPKYFRVMTR